MSHSNNRKRIIKTMAKLVLYGLQTKARFIAFLDDSPAPVAFDIEPGEEYPTVEKVSKDLGRTCKRIEERRTYYWLPLDCYNQPAGYTDKIDLFPTDYRNLKSCNNFHLTHPYWYIYANWMDAERRAID